jgi:hypothetical protein
MTDHPKIQDHERSVFERPGTIKLIWAVLIAGCAGFAAAGFWLAAKGKLVKKPHFEDKEGVLAVLGNLADGFPAFYALIGFVSFSFIVLAGQHLRKILMREEGYYDGDEARLPRNPVAEDEMRASDIDVAKKGEGR